MTYLDDLEAPDKITAELGDDGILEIRLIRPEKRNALNKAMERDYDRILDAAGVDDRVKAATVTGEGPVFSAGHDLTDPNTVAAFESGKAHVVPPLRSLPRGWYFNKPLIAGVHGYVGPGGMTLTATADFIIAAEGTRFSFEMTRRGGIAPSGTYLLLNLQLPIRVVKKLWMMGGWFEAEDALKWDFVQRVVPSGDLAAQTRAWAEQAVNIPAQQYAAAKQSLHRYYEVSGLASAIVTQNMVSGHGSDNAKDQQFWKGIRESGLVAQLAARDAAFDQHIAHV